MIVSLGMNFFLLSTRSYKPSEYLAEIEHSWFKKKKKCLENTRKDVQLQHASSSHVIKLNCVISEIPGAAPSSNNRYLLVHTAGSELREGGTAAWLRKEPFFLPEHQCQRQAQFRIQR